MSRLFIGVTGNKIIVMNAGDFEAEDALRGAYTIELLALSVGGVSDERAAEIKKEVRS